MKLSKRLETVASFVAQGSNIADIGTDHGYIPIALVERGMAASAIAMDVRSGPLERARAHIVQHGLEGRIETRLGDGVEKLGPGEADTVIIAGMGGELVIRIMEQGTHLRDSVKHWILSPQSELHKVRKYLKNQGFTIAREKMLCEDGKYYTVMDVERRENDREEEADTWTEAEYLYGPCLIREKNPVLMELLRKEERLYTGIIENLAGKDGEAASVRRQELKDKLRWIREAREKME